MAKKRTIDPAKGYRIHVNTRLHSELIPTFAQVHAGTSLEDSQWYPNDPDIKDRESRNVKTLDDLLTLMQTGDHARLSQSVVIFGTREIAWKDFFIREGKKDGLERFSALYNRVAAQKNDDLIPCAMLFEAAETKTVGLWHDKTKKPGRYKDVWIKGHSLLIDGKDVDFELFHTYLHGYDDKYIREGDLFLVTGMAQRSFTSRKRDTVRVYVDNKHAIRGVTRAELTTPPPPPKPLGPIVLRREDMGPLD